MSYDLDFWEYEDEPGRQDHQAVYERLCAGESVEGLRQIPADRILEAVIAAFSRRGWRRMGDGRTWEGKRGAFQLFLTSQLFRVDCHQMSGEEMNRFMDIAAKFGLRLYDPQLGHRFGGK